MIEKLRKEPASVVMPGDSEDLLALIRLSHIYTLYNIYFDLYIYIYL